MKSDETYSHESLMIRMATANLQYGTTGIGSKRHRILYPEKAMVEFPAFNPERAVQPIAIVSMPAMVNTKEVTLSHAIYDGDQIY